MKVTYDAEARAAYIYLSDSPVRGGQNVTDQVTVDLDKDGNAVGIELLDVDAPVVENITGRSADAAR
jgi:uncharacterized protein YuzE